MLTNLLTDEDNVLVQGLVRSKEVYATRDGDPDEMYPVVITSDKYMELTQQNDKLIQYDLQWQYSVDETHVVV